MGCSVKPVPGEEMVPGWGEMDAGEEFTVQDSRATLVELRLQKHLGEHI